MVANQEGGYLLAWLRGLDHVLDEVVVGVALVRKAPAIAHHGNHSRLRTIDEMGHYAAGAIFPLGDRYRHPGSGVRERVFDAPAYRLGQAQTVTGVTCWAGRIMLRSRRGVGKHRLAPDDVMRKAATGQNDAPFRMDANGPSVLFDHGAAHRAVLNDQVAHRGRQPQRYLQIEGRFRKASG